MNEKIFKDYIGQNIYLTFAPELFSPEPEHVLVVPIYKGMLLFTCHEKRGWELPGGKVEPGERAADAAVREAWEETGARIKNIKQIGEYRVEGLDGETFSKAIFVADVDRWEERPAGFETIDAALFPLSVNPFEEQFSPFMKDEVFASIRERLGTELPPST